MPAWLNTMLPVVTLALGAVLSHVADRSRDARQQSAARLAREADREQERRDRRETFELQHLIDLHTALTTLLRSSSRIHYANAVGQQETGTYASRLLPEDISDEHFEANRAVIALKELALDANIRDLADEAHQRSATVASLVNNTIDTGERALKRTVDAVAEAQTVIAGRIREIYVSGA